jgi:N-acetylglucosaminyldiphosphoundecaprenol N-acetyl-beta-D-mannosaminyltransferase
MDVSIPHVIILNTQVHSLTFQDTIELIEAAIVEKRNTHHVVVNAGKIVSIQKNRSLFESVINSDIINADGQSVVLASRFLGHPLPERVAGIDLMESLVELAHQKGYRCYFFGAKENVVRKVINHYTEVYSSSVIAGFRNGYFDKAEEEEIAKDIAESEADILFVAITSPKKEIFLNKYKEIIKTPFIMGVGGSFDVVAGVTKRAPKWMQDAGLEWFFRLVQEPRRMWKRYLVGNTKFVVLIIKQRLGLYQNPWME